MPGKHNARKRQRGEEVEETEPKVTTDQTLLNNAIQKILKRNLTKGEITYKIASVEGGYQASIFTPQMSDSFGKALHKGEVKETEHDAKESVAHVALEKIFGDPELLAIHDAPKPEKELLGEKPPPDAPRDKGKLRNAVLKICRISLKKEDITWETVQKGSGWVSTVTCSCLPGKWKHQKFEGTECEEESLAEHSAAAVAYEKLMADPQLAKLHDQTKGQREFEKKRKMEGNMNSQMEAMNPMMQMMAMNPMMQMMAMMAGGGMGGMGGMQPPAAKRRRKQ